jgi:drug/metabolite transporter (DMT)-like permease
MFLGELAALAAAATWAVGSYLFGRIGKGGMPAGAMNLGKLLSATAVFALTVLLATGRLLPAASSPMLAVLAVSGVIGLSLGDTAYFTAIATIGVRRALLLLSTAPVFAAVGGAVLLGERLDLLDVVSIAAVLAGVMLVVGERAPAASAEGSAEAAAGRSATAARARRPSREAMGVLFGVAAGVCQAAGSVMSRHAMASGIDALDTAFVRIASGLAGLVAIAAVTGTLAAWVAPLRAPRRFAAVAGASMVGTFCGIFLAQYGLGHASSTAVASTLLATSPIFALVLGRWLGADPVGRRAIAGTLLAVAGLAGLTLAHAASESLGG